MRECLEKFVGKQEEILCRNDGKKWHWDTVSMKYLEDKITEEYVELMAELRRYREMQTSPTIIDPLILNRVQEEAVDLANICMMVHDKLDNMKGN